MPKAKLESPYATPRVELLSTNKARDRIGAATAKRIAGTVHKRQAAGSAQRMRYAIAITSSHFPAKTSDDFSLAIDEALDEPFERQHMLWSLNSVEGPWAESNSGGAFAWLPAKDEDLTPLRVVADFTRMVYANLVPR